MPQKLLLAAKPQKNTRESRCALPFRKQARTKSSKRSSVRLRLPNNLPLSQAIAGYNRLHAEDRASYAAAHSSWTILNALVEEVSQRRMRARTNRLNSRNQRRRCGYVN